MITFLVQRSTRKFKDKAVPEELLTQVIEAGRYAPSGGNSQSTHFIVVENKDVLNELAELAKQEFAKMEIEENTYKSLVHSITASKKGDYVFHYNPAVLIITANKKDYGNNMVDCACVLENMMLMANALDLVKALLKKIKELSIEKKAVITDEEYLAFYNEMFGEL